MRTSVRSCKKLLGVLLTFSLLGSVASAHSWFICIGNDGHVEVEELLARCFGAETDPDSEAGVARATHDHGGCVDLYLEPQSIAESTDSFLAVASWQAGADQVYAPGEQCSSAPVAMVSKLLSIQRSVVLLI